MIRRLLRDRSASSAAEFALVLPLLLILLFAVIDGGRFLWTCNRAEKATQMGARMAVVTNYVSSAIGNSYLGSCSPALTQGDVIPSSCFTQISCTSSSCTSGTLDTTAFNNVVAQMRKFMPELAASNVTIQYSPSGLGYAGNPYGADVSPLVTVKLSGVQFRPLTAFMLTTITLPSFTTTLTAEDLSGTQSN